MYKMSEKSAAKTHGVPRQTLRRHLERARTGFGVQKVLGRPKTLTAEQEDELGEVIIDMEKRLFGLTRLHVRRLAYRHCEANKISHTFNRTEECAGNDWLDTLMKNYPRLSLRKPEPTSLARASGFNRENVTRFFDAYESVVFSSSSGEMVIHSSRIFNADETGFTVCHTPGKLSHK